LYDAGSERQRLKAKARLGYQPRKRRVLSVLFKDLPDLKLGERDLLVPVFFFNKAWRNKNKDYISNHTDQIDKSLTHAPNIDAILNKYPHSANDESKDMGNKEGKAALEGEGKDKGQGEAEGQGEGKGEGQGGDEGEGKGEGEDEGQGEDKGEGEGEDQDEGKGEDQGEGEGEDEWDGNGGMEGRYEAEEDQGEGKYKLYGKTMQLTLCSPNRPCASARLCPAIGPQSKANATT
jgi:hypothetical protein